MAETNICDALQRAREERVRSMKRWRRELDVAIQGLKTHFCSQEISLAITKVQEGVMWLGMELKRLGEENPYPNSYNPENAIVDPTADGLKL